MTRWFPPRWPYALSAALVTTGCCLYVAAVGVDRKAAQMQPQATPAARPAMAPMSSPYAPPERQFLEDMGRLAALASAHGMGFSDVQFQSEVAPASRLLIRRMRFQLPNDYAQVKAMLAAMMAEFAHLTLHEFRVDRKDANSSHGTIFCTLVLAYELPASTSAGSTAVAVLESKGP